MKEYFIFNISDSDEELEKRLKEKKWPIYARTSYSECMKKGTEFVIYEAGSKRHRFRIKAQVESIGKANSHDYPKAKKIINISNIIKFEPVDITKIYEKLHIIKNPNHYGVYLAGGIKKIDEHDFSLIIQRK